MSRAHRRSERVAYERDSRTNHNGYAETPATLAKAFEEAVERNKLKLAEQREELQRRARIRQHGRA